MNKKHCYYGAQPQQDFQFKNSAQAVNSKIDGHRDHKTPNVWYFRQNILKIRGCHFKINTLVITDSWCCVLLKSVVRLILILIDVVYRKYPNIKILVLSKL
ncbi:hypothetical protein BpHYR1_037173 [Brachionus plicatilis]|uniref:Uncharacterized protein n=1 Tax=Brachionus plicatilis TaxID=10195 RepID=A0A3M7RET7_BRAPC|nr:hypothetical protein BpHYR1_037173 [Brachionus plicatilis]